MGMVHCTDAAMIAGKRRGSIINISSIEGRPLRPGSHPFRARDAGRGADRGRAI